MYNQVKMLRLSFLGRFSVLLEEKPVQAFESDKVRGLLAYLAMEKDQQHRRDSLTGLFWPEMPEIVARHNLSQALYSLRTQLKLPTDQTPLVVTAQSIGFHLNHYTWVDVHHFIMTIQACIDHRHSSKWACQECLDRMVTAVDLYRGDFLAGLALNGCERFDDWLFLHRERLRTHMSQILERLTLCYEHLGNLDRAVEYARLWVSLDILNESGHRQLIRLLSRQGLRAEALAQYNACREILRHELGVEPDLETNRLVQEIRDGLAVQQTESPHHNLPSFLTPLIGRQAELSQIQQRINDPTCRLLTLVGPGGIGKTRLAVETGWKLLPSFLDGEFLVELQVQSASSSLLLAISKAANLGVLAEPETPRPSIHRGLKEQILDYLQDKNLLLILDGFEGYVTEAAFIGELLRNAPMVKVLVTSRTRLNLEGEQVFPVDGLPYPESFETGGSIENYEAIKMFINAAQRTVANYQLELGQQKAVVEICRIMQGIPLGILLAASWIGMMEPVQIAAEIRRNLDFLSSDWHDLPERQRSLRATFAYSLGLLPSDLQVRLLRLAVFTASFIPQRALQVTDTSLHQLRVLADHSLLIYNKDGRYQLHGILRRYAREALLNSPELERRTRDKYCKVFLEALAAWAPMLKNSSQSEALAEMDSELPDIQAAWTCAIGQKQLALLEEGAHGLGRYYYLRNQYSEGLSLFTQVLDAFSKDELLKSNPLLWARATSLQGVFLLALKDFDRSRQIFLEIEQRLRGQTENNPELALELAAALYKMSDLLLQTGGDRLQALAYAEEGLSICRECGEPWNISLALLHVAICQFRTGNIRQMLVLANEAMAIQAEVGDPELTHSIDTTLGFAALLAGHMEEALLSVQRQNTFLLRENTRRNQADAHGQLSLFLMYAGRFKEAQEEVDQALSLYIPPDEIVYLEYYALVQGTLQLYAGHYDAFRQAFAVHGESPVEFIRPQWQLLLAYLYLLKKQYPQAESALQVYIEYHASIQRWELVGHAQAVLSYSAWCQGDREASRRYLIDALENFLKNGFILIMVVSLYQIALILAENGELGEAAYLYSSLEASFVEPNELYTDLFGCRIRQLIAGLPSEALASFQAHVRATDLEAVARQYLVRMKNGPWLQMGLMGG